MKFHLLEEYNLNLSQSFLDKVKATIAEGPSEFALLEANLVESKLAADKEAMNCVEMGLGDSIDQGSESIASDAPPSSCTTDNMSLDTIDNMSLDTSSFADKDDEICSFKIATVSSNIVSEQDCNAPENGEVLQNETNASHPAASVDTDTVGDPAVSFVSNETKQKLPNSEEVQNAMCALNAVDPDSTPASTLPAPPSGADCVQNSMSAPGSEVAKVTDSAGATLVITNALLDSNSIAHAGDAKRRNTVEDEPVNSCNSPEPTCNSDTNGAATGIPTGAHRVDVTAVGVSPQGKPAEITNSNDTAEALDRTSEGPNSAPGTATEPSVVVLAVSANRTPQHSTCVTPPADNAVCDAKTVVPMATNDDECGIDAHEPQDNGSLRGIAVTTADGHVSTTAPHATIAEQAAAASAHETVGMDVDCPEDAPAVVEADDLALEDGTGSDAKQDPRISALSKTVNGESAGSEAKHDAGISAQPATVTIEGAGFDVKLDSGISAQLTSVNGNTETDACVKKTSGDANHAGDSRPPPGELLWQRLQALPPRTIERAQREKSEGHDGDGGEVPVVVAATDGGKCARCVLVFATLEEQIRHEYAAHRFIDYSFVQMRDKSKLLR